MSSSLKHVGIGSQASPVDRLATVRTTAVDQDALDVLRKALDDKGWTMVALSKHMGGKDQGYIHRVLNGEKPMPPGFLDDLPYDARKAFYDHQAEAHGSLVVPQVSPAEARRHLAIGLLNGGLALALPEKTAGQLKASAADRKEKVG